MVKPSSNPRIQRTQQWANDLWEAEAKHWDQEALVLLREFQNASDARVRERLERGESQAKDCAEYCRSRIVVPS